MNNLSLVHKFCQDRNYEKLVYDFHLLNWAWDDFDYGNEYTSYWETATRDTIEQIVVETANKWLEAHEQLITEFTIG